LDLAHDLDFVEDNKLPRNLDIHVQVPAETRNIILNISIF